MPLRSAKVRTRRSIWPRLYWVRSTLQIARTPSQKSTKSSFWAALAVEEDEEITPTP